MKGLQKLSYPSSRVQFQKSQLQRKSQLYWKIPTRDMNCDDNLPL